MLAPNLSAQVSGGALGLQLLAFWNNTSVWLRKRLRAPPLTWAPLRVNSDSPPLRYTQPLVKGSFAKAV